MNRLVLIGNGFDLAHGLPTRYEDFITWYKEHRIELLGKEHSNISSDPLCTIELLRHQALSIYVSNLRWENYNVSHLEIFDYIVQNTDDFKVTFSPLFERIIKGLESKTWAGIESDYYEMLKYYALDNDITNEAKQTYLKSLNEQLDYLKELLVKYLDYITTKNKVGKFSSIEEAIYAPFKADDISIDGKKYFEKHKQYWESLDNEDPLADKITKFGLDYHNTMQWVRWYKEDNNRRSVTYPSAFLLPDELMFLDFNYTETIQNYVQPIYRQSVTHIHGDIHDSRRVIFGHGDEIDENFRKLQDLNNNECLSNIKSIRYLEAPNYRRVLSFIESAPFQVIIMGHSSGISDRTLLNTIFEHKNCVSIKPYYYRNEDDGSDNYRDIVQNISRNFTDMKLMRDRVVNKTQCEPLVKE